MTEQITITNEGVIPGLDAMLATATGGKLGNFKEFVDSYNGSVEEVKKAKDQVKKLNNKLAKANSASIPTTGTDVVNAEELTYELVMKSAADVFPGRTRGGLNKDGKFVAAKEVRIADLDFPVATLVWKDKSGAIVQHPEVPKRDENYQLTSKNLLKFLTGFSKGMNTWLYGHTGTGKSTFVEQVASHLGFPVSRVNLDANLERADLVGHVVLREANGATISAYEEGILPRAMGRPGFLLLDEIDAGRPDILFVIQRALEGAGLMLTEDSGRIVKPHPLFRFVATANTRGQGDEYGIYTGTRNMNGSMIDRFSVFIEFNYLVKEAEIELLKKKYPDLEDSNVEQFVLFANEIRKAFANGELLQPITPRGLQTLAEIYLHFEGVMSPTTAGKWLNGEPMEIALEMTIYDKTTRDTVQKVREIADRCIIAPENKKKEIKKAA